MKTPKEIAEYFSKYFGKCVVLEVKEPLALNKETNRDERKGIVSQKSEGGRRAGSI